MKTTLQEKIDERVGEFKEKYKGILPPEAIEAGADWYRQAFLSIAKEVVEEMRDKMPKVITPTIEPPPNKLSQNQIFAGGQTNMAMRVLEVLGVIEKNIETLEKPNTPCGNCHADHKGETL